MSKSKLDEIRQRDELGYSETKCGQWSTTRIYDSTAQVVADRHALLGLIDALLPAPKPKADNSLWIWCSCTQGACGHSDAAWPGIRCRDSLPSGWPRVVYNDGLRSPDIP